MAYINSPAPRRLPPTQMRRPTLRLPPPVYRPPGQTPAPGALPPPGGLNTGPNQPAVPFNGITGGGGGLPVPSRLRVGQASAMNPVIQQLGGIVPRVAQQPGPGGGTPPAPAPAPAPAAGSNPFATDPGYLAALAAEQAGSQQADAALRAAQEAAIVGYGDPSLAAALGFNVDPNTAAAARQNYLAGNSTLARLDKNRQLSQQANINNLAAHGIINSGELGYQTGQIGQQYGRNVYDAQQQLLQMLAGVRQQTVQAKQGLQGQTISALEQAYQNAVAHPELYAGAAGVAAPPAAVLPTVPRPKPKPKPKPKPVSGYAQASRSNLH